jgi:chromosome partitioning protein
MTLPQKSSQSKVAKRQIRICIASNAGGSGKTTAAVHLAYAIAAKGFKVTIIELDISSSLSTFTGLSMNPEPQDSIAAVFEPDFAGSYPLKQVWAEKNDKITAIQGGEAIERVIREIPLNPRGHYLLQDRLEDYPLAADVILFDTPATLEPMGIHCFPAIRQSNYYLNASLERLPLQLYRPGCDAIKDFDPITAKIVELLTEA